MDSDDARLTAQKSNNARSESARAARAVGVVAAIVGALVPVITAPQSTAEVSTQVLLSSSDSSLQPIIDQILAAQQAALAADSSVPLATEASNAMLPQTLQMAALRMLATIAQMETTGHPYWQTFPFTTSGPAADTISIYGDPLPDNVYGGTKLAPGATYEITGTVGAGTADINVNALNETPIFNGALGPVLELDHNLQVNPDGTYTITVGPTPPSDGGNYVDSAGFNTVLIRDTVGNWALGPGTVDIQCVADCPPPSLDVTETGLSSAAISSMLTTIANGFAANNAFEMFVAQVAVPDLPANTFTPINTNSASDVGGLPNQLVSWGTFDLQRDQALIVKVPDIAAGYNSIQLNNPYGQALGWTLEQTSLNNTQAFHASDGYTYYVLSATNPGMANWVDTMGLEQSQIYLRWQNLPGSGNENFPTTVSTEVVPVADVSKYLPADTPTVSPEEFAADMNQRVLSYDYGLDISRTSHWVAENLWMNDLKQAMGDDQFHEVFGTFPATPMWLRLTPALSPDWMTVAKDFLVNPLGSMTAIQDNLALALKDITLPIMLAQALLQENFTETFQAVQADLSTGDFTQAFAALVAGGQQFGSILNTALLDPNTSITAGLLNARDDLATAVMAATKDGFPSELGPVATWEWQHMSELIQLGPGSTLTDLFALFQADDLLGE